MSRIKVGRVRIVSLKRHIFDHEVQFQLVASAGSISFAAQSFGLCTAPRCGAAHILSRKARAFGTRSLRLY